MSSAVGALEEASSDLEILVNMLANLSTTHNNNKSNNCSNNEEKDVGLSKVSVDTSNSSHNVDIRSTSKESNESDASIRFKTKTNICEILFLAISKGLDKVVLYLIDIEGVDVNTIHIESGKTPLLGACDCASTNLVKLLLERGANVQAKDKKGKTAFSIAKKRKNLDIDSRELRC